MEQGPMTPRPRPQSRGFSFKSDRSGGSKPKDEHLESPKDKLRRDSVWKGTSKANPNAAINEAQPGVNAVFEESTLQSLRTLEHRDSYGNVITDPDLSNPTRPRMERPLDTIRSFERAIDNGYKRRSSYQRADSSEQQNNQYNGSRRNSGYFGDYNAGSSAQSRYAQSNAGGYYGNQRPESNYAGAGPSAPPRSRYGPRMQSDSAIHGPARPYPQHSYHQSQDTMNTGVTNGSDSTGPWANSTDPSSENSSVDRVAAAPKPNGDNGYGPNGYVQNNGYGQNGYAQNGYGQNGYGMNGVQNSIPEESGMYPPSGGAPPGANRRPIPLGNSVNAGNRPAAAYSPPEPEKKKGGWLKRRFSKNP